MTAPDPRWQRLHALARRQGGAFGTAQAIRHGIGGSELATLQRRGHLLRLHPRVWAAAGTPMTQGLQEHAALLRLGRSAVLSHLSAAAHYGLAGAPGRPWLSIPSTHRAPLDGSVKILRTRHIDALMLNDGRRVTTPSRTIVDLARCLSERELGAALLTLLQRGTVTADSVLDAAERAGSPYPGSAVLRGVVATFRGEHESILGLEAWELLRHDVAGLVVGHPVALPDGGTALCDLAVPALRLDIEIDSWAWHGSKVQQRADKERDRRFAAAGWQTLRLTTDDVRRTPEATRRQVVAVVAERRRRAA